MSLNTDKGILKASMGGHGIKIITSSDGAVTGNFCGFKVLSEAVVSAVTGSVTGLTSKTLNDNLSLEFPFTSITLTSGTLALYYESEV